MFCLLIDYVYFVNKDSCPNFSGRLVRDSFQALKSAPAGKLIFHEHFCLPNKYKTEKKSGKHILLKQNNA